MNKKILISLLICVSNLLLFADESYFEGLWSDGSNAAPSTWNNGDYTSDFLSIKKIDDQYLIVYSHNSGLRIYEGIANTGIDSDGNEFLVIKDLYGYDELTFFMKSPLENITYPNDWIESIWMGPADEYEYGDDMSIFYRSGYSELHRIGSINDNNVRYRKFPTTDDKYKGKKNEILGKYNEGQELEILWRSDSKMRIGNMEDYWYMVKDVNDIPVNMTGWPYRYGWVYGAFLDIEEE
jgi:hypothetical protein